MREREKFDHYKLAMQAGNAAFYPFVVETFGTMGVQAYKVADLYAKLAVAAHTGMALSEARRHFTRMVQCSLAQGNARLHARGIARQQLAYQAMNRQQQAAVVAWRQRVAVSGLVRSPPMPILFRWRGVPGSAGCTV